MRLAPRGSSIRSDLGSSDRRAYDARVIEDYAPPTERARKATIPTIVLTGGASFPFTHETAKVLVDALQTAGTSCTRSGAQGGARGDRTGPREVLRRLTNMGAGGRASARPAIGYAAVPRLVRDSPWVTAQAGGDLLVQAIWGPFRSGRSDSQAPSIGMRFCSGASPLESAGRAPIMCGRLKNGRVAEWQTRRP